VEREQGRFDWACDEASRMRGPAFVPSEPFAAWQLSILSAMSMVKYLAHPAFANVASKVLYHGFQTLGAYTASKHVLLGITRT